MRYLKTEFCKIAKKFLWIFYFKKYSIRPIRTPKNAVFFLFLVIVLYRGFSKKIYDCRFRLETKTPKKFGVF